jgi:hypothetical protein
MIYNDIYIYIHIKKHIKNPETTVKSTILLKNHQASPCHDLAAHNALLHALGVPMGLGPANRNGT